VRIEKLRTQGLRCLTEVELSPDPLLNVLVGSNGAGKTSLLEAIYLLSHGRSFRTGAKDALVQRDAQNLSVFAEIHRKNEQRTRLGLGREGSRWEAKLDGEPTSLSSLVQNCAVVCFEPGSHALIAGASERRRQYLDWGVFHVEPTFLAVWRGYQRALKQRNALLRSCRDDHDPQFDAWELEMSDAAALIDDLRARYVESLIPHLDRSTYALLEELGPSEFVYRRGWPADTSLASFLKDSRRRDIARGHTAAGIHRADWSINYQHAPLREHLSRGQEKLTALACMLAQAQLYRANEGEWPIVCLDDLASELDADHQQGVVAQLKAADAQVFLTGTEIPASVRETRPTTFHVEQGKVTRLL
jgi:DNA replication and repair protein RecF